jgi:hypothetical protein
MVTSSVVRRRIWTLACAAAVVALAAACGSSSSSSSAPAASGSTPPTSSAPASTGSGGGGISSSSFCGVARKWKAQEPKEIQALRQLGSGPAALKAVYTKLGQDYQALIAVAPSQIKPSLQVLYGDFVKVNAILAKHNYNIVQAAPVLAQNRQLFDSTATKQAIAKLDAWAASNHCHL